MDAKKLKDDVCAAVDATRDEILRVSRAIHAHPELAFEEVQAARLLVEALREAGLDVSEGAYGLETAFESEFGREDGPRVAVLAEYDALPGIGHACGHNIIASSALGAALGLAALGERLPGRVRLLGTPAEEHGCGKELMAREGAVEGVDAALMVHPAGVDLANMPCIAMSELEVVYHGRSAHASALPERGVNALDAIVIAYQGIAALRQHIAQSERIHGIITDGGQAPNIVPERTAGRFYVRATDFERLEPLKRRVESCFRAGADATGCDVEIQWGAADYRDILFNEPLAAAYQSNAESLGREFIPWERLPASVAGSTDLGNLSYRLPCIHPMIAASPVHVTIHNPEFEKWAGSEMGDAAAIDGAKALAMTAIDFFCDASLRERAAHLFEAQRPRVNARDGMAAYARLQSIHDTAWIAPSAQIYGKIAIGEGSSIWHNAVARAECQEIRIGCFVNIQDFVMIHVGYGEPTTIGDYCSITHHATVHGCTLGDACLVGPGAVIMDGASIGPGSIVAAGAVVPEGKIFPAHSIIAGVPGKVIAERDSSRPNRLNAWQYQRNAELTRNGNHRAWDGPDYEAWLAQKTTEVESDNDLT